MKHRFHLWFALLLCYLATSCQESKVYTAADLKSEMASGVALVVNRYYYELRTGDGKVLYFTGIDNDTLAHLTTEHKNILPFREGLTGTAFFINSKGTLLTNRHVAAPELEIAQVKQVFRHSLQSYKDACKQMMDQLVERYSEINEELPILTTDEDGDLVVDEEATQEKRKEQEQLEEAYNQIKDRRESINLDTSDMKLSVVSELGIAYDGTYPSSFTDYKSCVRRRESEDENVDLALIQLKDGITPTNAHVFHIAGLTENNLTKTEQQPTFTIGTPVFLMGYNRGYDLAFTQNGLQLQITEGKITQMPDGTRMLYDMSSLQGSSGGPVVDQNGQVVAVNFAKIGGTDTFNFGIPLPQIHRFLLEAY